MAFTKVKMIFDGLVFCEVKIIKNNDEKEEGFTKIRQACHVDTLPYQGLS